MRITNSMMTMNLLANINNNLTKMSKKQDELATGKRIHTASDDPVLAAKILARRTDLAELEQYSKNTNDALGWMEVTEKALEDNGDIFQKIRELTVQAANGTNTADDTQKIKLEIENMKEQLIANGNSTFAGRYIFSGFETNKKLLNKDGTFNIDIDQYAITNKPIVKYEVGFGESIDVMTSGLDIYGIVKDSNIMTTGFTNATIIGTASSFSFLMGNINRSSDYTASNQDVDINGVVYNVDESLLDGTSGYLSQEQVIEVFENASDGFGNLMSSVANISYNDDGKFVVELKAEGVILMTPQSPVSIFAAAVGGTSVTGVDIVEVSIISSAYGNPTLPLPENEIDILKNEQLMINLNGESLEFIPRETAVILTMDDYVLEMNVLFDKEFGVGKLLMTVDPVGIITLASQNTEPLVEPMLSVEFPKFKTGFPSGENLGLSATKSSLSGIVDFSLDYSATVLDLSIAGVAYAVDETNLNGTLTEFEKTDIIEAYLNADDGFGNVLGTVASVYFDANNNIIIEAKAYGNTVMTPQVAGGYFDAGNGGIVYSGTAPTEASLSGLSLGDPTLPLLQEDIDILVSNPLNIVVNSISKQLVPSVSATINNLNDYVLEMNIQLTKEFGIGKVLMSVDPIGVITVETTNSIGAEVPIISIDFNRTKNSELISDIDELIGYLDRGDHENISKMITVIDKHMDNMLSLRADIGARTNRMDLTLKKIASNNISFTRMLSDAEDADMSEVIMQLKNAENVYKASLSTGARVIQPSLIDFLR